MDLKKCKILSKAEIKKLESIYGDRFYEYENIPELQTLFGRYETTLRYAPVDELSVNKIGANTIAKHCEKLSLMQIPYDNIPMMLSLKMGIHNEEFKNIDLSRVFINSVDNYNCEDGLTKIGFSTFGSNNDTIAKFTYSDYELRKCTFYKPTPVLFFTIEKNYDISSEKFDFSIDRFEKATSIDNYTYEPVYMSNLEELSIVFVNAEKLMCLLGDKLESDEMLEISIYE